MQEWIVAHESEVGELKLEVHPDLGLFVHCDIYKWTVSNAKEAMKQWKAFMEKLREQGFTVVYGHVAPDDVLHQKFVKHFGWTKTEYKLTKDDLEFDVWSYEVGDK